MIDLITEITAQDASRGCQGQVFKASVNNSRLSHGFAFTVRLTVAKKYSCPGCPACDWQWDAFGEVGNDWPILGIEKAEDGALYRVEVCNVTRCRDTGSDDGFDLGLVEYTPAFPQAEATEIAP